MSTTETETAHKHSLPCNPPGGTFLNPGPCECGKTHRQDSADQMLALALEALKLAYGVPPRVSTHWALHYGSESLNDGIGCVDPYDDEEDAREHLQWRPDTSVVKRTVIALRWEAVSDEDAEAPAS